MLRDERGEYCWGAAGWGAGMGFPGIVPDANGEVVKGYLLTSGVLGEHWTFLDEFEGEGYQRQKVSVQIRRGQTVAAFVYAVNL